MKLPRSFYLNPNVVKLAKELIGTTLFTNLNGEIAGGIITETEAYAGVTDKASHAYGGRRTKRTEVMYLQGGTAYVYLCYGIHALFNIVTGPEDVPHAILIRGIKASHGIEIVKKRLQQTKFNDGWISGPGKVSKALGITTSHTETDLLGQKIWLERAKSNPAPENIKCSPRVGIGYAGEDALLPYRFIMSKDRYSDIKS